MRIGKVIEKNCLLCKALFLTYPSHAARRKYCSCACNAKANRPQVGHKLSESVREHLSRVRKGLHVGPRNPLWKGNKVGYRALHYWVSTHLGKPTTCESCKKTGLTGRKIQWANKSRQYKRDLSDWMRLCVPCHMQYDRH